jgi:DNA-binding NtrC family response regulator
MRVLLIDDDDVLRDLLSRELTRRGHEVVAAATGKEGIAKAPTANAEVVLLDLNLPDMSGLDVLRQLRADKLDAEVILLTAHGTVDTAIQAMKLGAYDFLQKPCHLEELELSLQRAGEHRRLGEENEKLKESLGASSLGGDFVGTGPAFAELQRFISKVAASDSTVLLRGETGTGKGMLAASIHRLSKRADKPFVTVDCAALHENLLQSELFGHEKGAFTGAVKLKRGLFEAAEGGTVFLDEIGDVSAATQAGLLRVLEAGTFRRVGGTQELHADVRLVAATNRDLERHMADGQFRRDLYFRLNTIHLKIPPLRERRADIPYLAAHFVDRYNERYETKKSISPEAIEAMSEYGWPGNVRELRHCVERALVLAEGDEIGPEDLPAELHRRPATPANTAAGEPITPLLEMEKRYIARVLAEMGGHRSRTAMVLGISERNLYRKIREYGLDATPAAPAPEGKPE